MHNIGRLRELNDWNKRTSGHVRQCLLSAADATPRSEWERIRERKRETEGDLASTCCKTARDARTFFVALLSPHQNPGEKSCIYSCFIFQSGNGRRDFCVSLRLARARARENISRIIAPLSRDSKLLDFRELDIGYVSFSRQGNSCATWRASKWLRTTGPDVSQIWSLMGFL